MLDNYISIANPKIRILEDLKARNKDNMRITAGEYFGAKYTYAQTFKMIDDYKKAFIAVDGLNEHSVTICAPSTIASVNAFYGAIDANKPVNLTVPVFCTHIRRNTLRTLTAKRSSFTTVFYLTI